MVLKRRLAHGFKTFLYPKVHTQARGNARSPLYYNVLVCPAVEICLAGRRFVWLGAKSVLLAHSGTRRSQKLFNLTGSTVCFCFVGGCRSGVVGLVVVGRDKDERNSVSLRVLPREFRPSTVQWGPLGAVTPFRQPPPPLPPGALNVVFCGRPRWPDPPKPGTPPDKPLAT